ncbi:hypothetical protein [Paenibacillus allorhizoplanae]|uniref:hypothetical protein n=1 Tax=Paenibacillus allorhizoplanae TaxID=2905648 RepID=UPI001F316039|nr:hypothetical protein [Paenibacillus allorhizoplanae]
MRREKRGMMTAKKFITAVCIGSIISVTALQPVSAESSQGESLAKATTPFKTVESYVIETYSDTKNAEGYYEKTGYEVVNAVTNVFVGKGETVSSEIK